MHGKSEPVSAFRGVYGRLSQFAGTGSAQERRQAAARGVSAERQARERHELRQRFRPYPDLEQRHRQQKNPHLAEQWQYRDHVLPGMEGEGDDRPRPRGIADYVYSIQGREVHYSRKTSTPGDIAFIDRGRRIEIQDWRSRESVLAALQRLWYEARAVTIPLAKDVDGAIWVADVQTPHLPLLFFLVLSGKHYVKPAASFVALLLVLLLCRSVYRRRHRNVLNRPNTQSITWPPAWLTSAYDRHDADRLPLVTALLGLPLSEGRSALRRGSEGPRHPAR